MPITFAKLGEYGRLGNQLWQISATIGHAIRHNDLFVFPDWKYKHQFNIPLKHFVSNIRSSNVFEEPHFHYISMPYWKDMNLLGYFQSPRYWADIKDKILTMLTPNINVLCNDHAFIHIRRGDYLQHVGCYEILGMDYYEKAMEKVGSSRYLIFSDDIAWCKDHFIGNAFDFAEGSSNVEDLALMSNCQAGGICANSSFSFWGGILNSKTDNIVMPKKWFGPKLASTHDTKDLVYGNWVKI